MKQELPRVYGDTNGDLYNFVWSWMTSELNMWEVGKGPNGKGKRIEGKNTLFVIKFEDIPKDRLN